MDVQKSDLLALIQAEAEQEARVLAGEFVRAAVKDREAILAGMEFEKWLAESCGDLARRAEFGHRRPV